MCERGRESKGMGGRGEDWLKKDLSCELHHPVKIFPNQFQVSEEWRKTGAGYKEGIKESKREEV